MNAELATIAPKLKSASTRLVSIDVLRGLAVLAVVAIHTPHYAHGGFRENPWFFVALLMDYGYLGVPLFIIISGFSIHRRAALAAKHTGHWSLDWISFWKRRFWRLYPPYIGAIVFSLMCVYMLDDNSKVFTDEFGWDIVTHIFMVHNLTADYASGLGNGAFWTLGMEEQLYGLYFFLFLFFRKRSHMTALLMVAVITITWRISILLFQPEPWGSSPVRLGSWGQWPFTYWLYWCLGAVAVDAYLGNIRLPQWTRSLSIVVIGLCVGIITNRVGTEFLAKTSIGDVFALGSFDGWLPWMHIVGEFAFAITFFVLLNWCIDREEGPLFKNMFGKSLAQLGRVSYSVYLVHVPVLYVLTKWLPFGLTPMDWFVQCVLFMSISIATGVLFFIVVERRFLAGRYPRMPWQRTAAKREIGTS